MARRKKVKRAKGKVAVEKKTARRGAVIEKSKFKSIITGDIKKDIKLIINNFLLFVALSLVSFVLYSFLMNDFLKSLFYVTAVVFGSVSVALLIYFLVLMIMNFVSKRK